jgi:CRP/FNR family transcriptional regulator, cyclic AMP receptor protein
VTSGPDGNPDPDEVRQLSPGEREVLELLAKGLTYPEIAEIRGVSEGTVRSQAHWIRRKLSRQEPGSGGENLEGLPGDRRTQTLRHQSSADISVRETWPPSSFVGELPDTERASLLAAGDLYRFDDEKILLVQGEPGDFVYVLASGLVKVVVEASGGAKTTLAIRSRGDLVGEEALLDNKPHVATVYAVGPVAALEIGGSAFMSIFNRSPAAQATVNRYLLAKLRNATEQRAADRVWDAKERVAQVLYELGEKHAEPGPDGWLRLPITQGELGDLAGVAVSTAERVLKDLRKQGVITSKYREITIKYLAYLGSIRFPH